MNKERFVPTYFDSEQYYKQNINQADNNKVNEFSPTEPVNPGTSMQTGYAPKYQTESTWTRVGYPVANDQLLKESQVDWIKNNSLYNEKKINGIPLKDYYDKYTKDVLQKGTWFLNKDMPQDTKQYLDNSDVQQRMEIYTGLRQERDRVALGKPNKTETLNLFTPAERTTGYGYQYGQSGGSGPGLELTRQKEIEELKRTVKFKTNEKPIEQIHVGRGIAVGTEVPAAGGFQQYTRIVPDNISDYSSNQLPGMVTGEKWAFSNAPTSQTPVMKNRVNKYYSLCQYGPGPGRAAMTAEMTRPDYAVTLKNQNRSFINYGFGAPLQNLESYLTPN
jgi:hypothetical protein